MKYVQEILLNPNKTCAVTGHRDFYSQVDRKYLKDIFERIIDREYDTFLIGMAVGFDTVCFQILEEIREKRDIKIIACIPCLNQDKYFCKESQKEYQRMLKSADQRVVLEKVYTKNCMIKRNDFLVENSSMLVAYCRREKTGTAYTVKRAEKKGSLIIKV